MKDGRKEKRDRAGEPNCTAVGRSRSCYVMSQQNYISPFSIPVPANPDFSTQTAMCAVLLCACTLAIKHYYLQALNMTSSLLVASLLLHFTMLLRCSIRVTALTLVSQNDTTSGSAGKYLHENSLRVLSY